MGNVGEGVGIRILWKAVFVFQIRHGLTDDPK